MTTGPTRDAPALATILELDELAKKRDQLGRIVATCGGYDPIHPGHLSCIVDSSRYGDTLVVFVNKDEFLVGKKGKPFQDCDTRCRIVSYCRAVDYVVPFGVPGDSTMIEALRGLRPHVFTKGGDRTDASNIPEWDVCQEHEIEIVTGVGLDKEWSSSNFLADWEAYLRENKRI